MSVKSRSRVTVSIAGIGNLGVFATRTGGNADSAETKHSDGGMVPEVALGGAPTTSNVTVSRRYDPDRDGPLRAQLYRARERSAAMTVTSQPLDKERNPRGKPTVWTGVVKSFNMPDDDANDSGVAMLEIEQSTDALVGA
jgi:hypothetical protein